MILLPRKAVKESLSLLLVLAYINASEQFLNTRLFPAV